ncbi:MAG: hypothetical protein A2X35_05855 [Elusimicrobia bacterium GWA2_61_42]|nr:MAG: hypothetical protein A2X35_05855 [Elusimicrobia bacterium GWA2_61_42]OGR80290.1 MAG: hypothetical protein A2X38_00880 [Elusimicrobia bacterium GWC2_61_25]
MNKRIWLTSLAAALLLPALVSGAYAGARPKLKLQKGTQSVTSVNNSSVSNSSGSWKGEAAHTGGAGITFGGSMAPATGGSYGSSSTKGGSASGGGGGSQAQTSSSGSGSSNPGTSGGGAVNQKVVFSSKRNGVSEKSFLTTQLIYGVVYGLGPNSTYSCACPKLSGACADRGTWTKLPNPEWSYDSTDKTWRMAAVLNGIPAGSYELAFEDRASGAQTGFAYLDLTSPRSVGCRWNSPDPVVGPCSGPYVNNRLLDCTANNNGQVLNTQDSGQSCPARWTCTCG